MDEATWNEAEQIEIEQIILQESQNHPESKMQLLIDRSLFESNTPYFLALKSYDQKTISNIAQFTLDKNGAVSGSDDKIPYNDEDKQAGRLLSIILYIYLQSLLIIIMHLCTYFKLFSSYSSTLFKFIFTIFTIL